MDCHFSCFYAELLVISHLKLSICCVQLDLRYKHEYVIVFRWELGEES